MAVTLRTTIFQILPIALTVVLLAVSLVILNLSTQNPDSSEGMIRWLAPLNVAILLILSVLILFNLYQAVTRLRTQQAGSRFTLRLMMAFSILTVIPVLVVTYFSMNFLGDRIDNWFNVKIEGALDDSLELARSSLNVRMRQHLYDVEKVARELTVTDPLDYASTIESRMRQLGAYEMVLLGKNNRILVYSGDNQEVGTLIPHFPADEIMRSLSSRGYMSRLEYVGDDSLYSRVAITLRPNVASGTIVLTALFQFSDHERYLSGNVQKARNEYQNINYQRDLIKQSFRLTLFLIMVLSILSSVWAAFLYSRRLTSPVRKLLEGTLAVASGNLQKKLPVSDKDDFSLLARSFNTMTTRLSDARYESEQSQRQVQRQHDYLNVVLDHLTSGVVTIDDQSVIRRINSAAEDVLQIPLSDFINQSLFSVGEQYGVLQPLLASVASHLQRQEKEWQCEASLMLESGRRMLVCRGTELPQLLDGSAGHVLVLEDITDVVQAEHEAAWSEVARRLAHEIKNPLTPIRLSAERLQYRLHPELSEQSAELLKRMSGTIMNQVDNLKGMVDAFSEYARAPALQLQRVDLNALVSDVAELYKVNDQGVTVVVETTEVPELYLDSGRIRQLVVNLLKNAFEAFSEQSDIRQVTLLTKLSESHRGKLEVELTVADTGSGIPADILPHLFDPYVSRKQKGSGLGLSIVKKIVEEHSARVVARNNETSGAAISIYFPLQREQELTKNKLIEVQYVV
ncbi:MAG: PAS domain-containing sensor histidine kinase [Proteobacteria bacterium]|nr:MAG: PAS domain-containing sensor histidine kinase [Pseudomonadota bacterium]